MNLYLLRHAHALDVGEQGIENDDERPLSDQGRQQMEAVGDAIKRLALKFDHILSSPLRRAMQSAEALCQALGVPESTITTCDQLAPGCSTRKLSKRLRGLEGDNILLVGHEPDLSKHLVRFIGSKRAQVELPKAGVACLRCESTPGKGSAVLEWLLTPTLASTLNGRR
jgi:phosphohistidine phosphatase